MISDESSLRSESEILCEMFQARVRLTPSNTAYQQFDAQSQVWSNYSWANIGARVVCWCAAFSLEEFPSGARIAVLVSNGIEHVCLDQAAMSLGCVPVPLHVVDNPENLAYVIADSGASLLLVGSADQWATLAPYQAQWPNLRRVVYLLGTADATATDLAVGIDEWLAKAERPSIETTASVSVIADTLAAIVYTSGTTGRPKGVMLSHRNVVSNVNAIMAVMPVREDDSFLSFLPLSHTFERTVGYYLPIAAGASVAFARSIPPLMEDLIAIRPTVLVSVPRIYERAYAALRESVDRHWITRQLFTLTVKIGWRRFEHSQSRAPRPSMLLQVLFSLLDRLIATQVRSRLVVACAPQSLEVRRWPRRSLSHSLPSVFQFCKVTV
jgi:long-chain acyl-CoA synthetase